MDEVFMLLVALNKITIDKLLFTRLFSWVVIPDVQET